MFYFHNTFQLMELMRSIRFVVGLILTVYCSWYVHIMILPTNSYTPNYIMRNGLFSEKKRYSTFVCGCQYRILKRSGPLAIEMALAIIKLPSIESNFDQTNWMIHEYVKQMEKESFMAPIQLWMTCFIEMRLIQFLKCEVFF